MSCASWVCVACLAATGLRCGSALVWPVPGCSPSLAPATPGRATCWRPPLESSPPPCTTHPACVN
ncbi:hypothetical protein E2C01_101131 [Portunus trituberculatus]|uniref:Secreted protein n=1 Tax=Portunus trituberculatus TaxID=210409 RepID=A0A5B7K8S5_PORTR|nr:hypothetical protein [Portunus trituberculatus]